MKNIDIKNLDFKKIPKEMLIAVGVSILLVVLFVMFVYIPTGKRMRDMKGEAAEVSRETSEIRGVMGDAKSVDEAVLSMNKSITHIENLFPRKEEVILSELSNLATSMNMEVVSISPQKKSVVTAIDGVTVSVEGSVVVEMPIRMSLRARYKSVGDLIIALRGAFPMLVKVDNLDLSSAGKEDGVLNVNLQLNSYMLSDTAE